MPRVDPKRVQRALSERIYLLSVEEHGVLNVVGSTGENVYQVTVGREIDCSCPDSQMRGNCCKHQIYTWVRVFQLDVEALSWEMDDELYEEIQTKLRNIPQLCFYPHGESSVEIKQGNAEPTATRKSVIENDCPICFDSFSEADEVMWCQFSCGNNVHAACFKKWSTFQKTQSCVFCRRSFLTGQ